MSFDYFFGAKQDSKQSQRRRRQRQQRRQTQRHLLVESLERRDVMATFVWDGGGVDNNWATPANWVGNVAPTGAATDDLVFTGSVRTENNNNFPAGTAFNSITFDANASNFTITGNRITLNGGVDLRSVTAGVHVVYTPLTLNTASTVDVPGGHIVLVGAINGSGSLTKTGAFGLDFYAANTFSGGITVKAGHIGGVYSPGAFGSGTITLGDTSGSEPTAIVSVFDGAYSNPIVVTAGNTGLATLLTNTTNATFSGPITLNGHDLRLASWGTTNLNVSGGITGTGSLLLEAASTGVVTLSGGGINPSGAIINFGYGSATNVVNAPIGSNITGIFQNSTTSPLNVSGGITVNSNATELANIAGAKPLTVTGNISGAGNLVLNNNSTAGDAIFIQSGSVNNVGTITNSGIGTGPGWIAATIGTNVTGVIQNSATSYLMLSGANTFSSGATIKAGMLAGNVAGAFGTGTIKLGVAAYHADVLLSSWFNGTITNPITVASNNNGIAVISSHAVTTATFSGPITLNSHNLHVDPWLAAGLTLSGGIVGAGDVILSGTGTGTVSLAGASVNPSGTIRNARSGVAATTISAPIGSNVTSIRQDSLTSELTISGAIAVNSNATTLVNSGAAGFMVQGGVSGVGNLLLRNDGSATNGVYLLNGAVNNIGTVTNAGAGTGNVWINTVIGANVTGVVQESSTSSVTFSGANTFSSGLTIKAGVAFGNASANAFGTGTITIGNSTGNANATLASWFQGTHPNPISVAAGNTGTAAILATSVAGVTFSGPVTIGNHSLRLLTNGATALTLTGGISGTGDVVLDGDGTGTITLAGGSVNSNGAIRNVRTGVATTTISAPLGGNVTSIIQNSGTSNLAITAASSYIGDVTVSAGTLNLSGSSALSAASILTVDGYNAVLNLGGTTQTIGTLKLKNNGVVANGTLSGSAYELENGSVSAVLAGSGTLTKTTAGTVLLSGANTYGGATTIGGGKLLINGTLAAGAGGIEVTRTSENVYGNAVLAGQGTIQRNIVWGANGYASPGDGPGVLTVAGAEFAAGSFFSVQIGGLTPGNSPANHDQLRITGSGGVTIDDDATLSVTMVNGFVAQNGNSFVIIDNQSPFASVSGTFKGLPQGAVLVTPHGQFQINYFGGTGNDVVLTRVTPASTLDINLHDAWVNSSGLTLSYTLNTWTMPLNVAVYTSVDGINASNTLSLFTISDSGALQAGSHVQHLPLSFVNPAVAPHLIVVVSATPYLTDTDQANNQRTINTSDGGASRTDLVAQRLFTEDGELKLEFDVLNATAAPFTVGLYRSANGSTRDGLLTAFQVTDPALLAVGTGRIVTLPASFNDIQEDYYLVAYLDVHDDVSEQYEHFAPFPESSWNNQAVLVNGAFVDQNGILQIHRSDEDDVTWLTLTGESLLTTSQPIMPPPYWDVTGDRQANQFDIDRIVAHLQLASQRPWMNPNNPYDVNNDGIVSAIDSVLITNTLNAVGVHELVGIPTVGQAFVDVSGDGWLTSLDLLMLSIFENSRSQRLWTNYHNPLDVTMDGTVTMADVAALAEVIELIEADTWNMAALTGIHIRTHGSDDLVILNDEINLPVVVFGGAGDDYFSADSNNVIWESISYNHRPIVANLQKEAIENGTPLQGSFIGSDADGDTLTFEVVNYPTQGSVVNNNNGTFTFYAGYGFDDLAVGETRQVTFTYKATDTHHIASQLGTVTVTVTGSNDAPTVISTSLSISEDGSGVTTSVLANDTDSDDDATTLAYTIVTPPSQGTVVSNGNGTFTFQPDAALQDLSPGQSRKVTFIYQATDAHNASSTGTVTVTVYGANDAPVAVDANISIIEDEAAVITGVLADDIDGNHDASSLVYTLITLPAAGTVTSNGNGTFTFQPGMAFQDLAVGQSRDVAFTFQARDPNYATSNIATVTITVTGTNDAPVAVADESSTPENAEQSVDVVANDTDIDGGALSLVAASATLISLVRNGTGQPIPIATATIGQNGNQIVFNPGSDLDFLPDGETATAVIQYQVADDAPMPLTALGTWTIQIAGTNDAPVVTAPLAHAVSEDATTNLIVDLTDGVEDIDTGDLLVVSGSTLLSGNDAGITIVGNLLQIDPTAYQYLNASSEVIAYSYQVSDSHGGVVTHSATITIDGANDAPVAGDASVAATEGDTSVTIGVLADDADGDDDAGSLVYSLISPTAEGSIVNNGNGTFTFTPGSDFQDLAVGQTRDVTFTYQVTDSHGAVSDVGTVTITVAGANSVPMVNDAVLTATEDGAGVSTSVLADDVDSDDDAASLAYAIVTPPTEGSVIINGDGTFTFLSGTEFQDLAAGQSRQVTFTYLATDAHGAVSGLGTVTITVSGANDAPVASAGTLAATEDGAVVVTSVLADDIDSDDDADSLTYTIVAAPLEGGVASLGDGRFAFDPGSDFQDLAFGQTRQVTFTYQVTDSHNASSAIGTVAVTVTGENDAPTVGDAALTISEDSVSDNLTVPADDIDSDNDAASLFYVVVTPPVEGTVLGHGNGTFSFLPGTAFQDLNEGQSRQVTFTYQAIDAHGAVSNLGTATITVAGANNAPVAVADESVTTENSGPSLDVTANDIDVDSGTVLNLVANSATLVSLVLASTGQAISISTASVSQIGNILTFTSGTDLDFLPVGEFAVATIQYQVTDGTATPVQGTWTVQIAGANDAPIANSECYPAVEFESLVGTSLGANLLANDTDVDVGDVLSVAKVNGAALENGVPISLPSGATLLMNADGSFIYDPSTSPRFRALSDNQVDVDSFQYTVRDLHGGEAVATASFVIEGFTGTASRTMDEDSLIQIGNLRSLFADVFGVSGGVSPTFSVVSASSLLSATVNGTQLTFAPAANQHGDGEILIGATNGTLSAQVRLQVTVLPVNDSPHLLVGFEPIATLEDTPIAAIAIDGHFADVDADELTYTATTSNGLLAAIEISNNNLAINLLPHQVGAATITVRASDPHGAWAEASFSLTASPVNDAPVIINPITDFSVEPSAPNKILDLRDVFSDPDIADALSFTATSDATHLVATSIANGLLTLSFADELSGPANITVRATDSAGAWVEDTFVVTTGIINRRPTGPQGPVAIVANEDDPPSAINLASYFADPDGAPLTYSVVENDNPQLLTASLVASTLSLTFLPNASGTAALRIHAYDPHGAYTEGRFVVQVKSLNDVPPGQLPAVWVSEGSSPRTIDIASYFGNADYRGRPFEYSIVSNSNASLVRPAIIEATGQLMLTFLPYQSGMATLAIEGKDSDGSSVAKTMQITVGDLADDLVGGITAYEDSGPDLVDLKSVFGTTLADGATFSLENNDSPELLSAVVKGNSLLLNYTPDAFGQAILSVRAVRGDSVLTRNLVVNVAAVNDSPVTLGIDNIVMLEDSTTQLNISELFSDPEGGSLTYGIELLEHSYPGAPVTPQISAGILHLTAVSNRFGYAHFLATATDAQGLSAATTFWVIVNPVNDAPLGTSKSFSHSFTPGPDLGQHFGMMWYESSQPHSSMIIDLRTLFSDIEDGADLEYEISVSGNATTDEPFVDDNDLLHYTYNPAPGFAGASQIVVTARDRDGAIAYTASGELPVISVSVSNSYVAIPFPENGSVVFPNLQVDVYVGGSTINRPILASLASESTKAGNAKVEVVVVGNNLTATVLKPLTDIELDRGITRRPSPEARQIQVVLDVLPGSEANPSEPAFPALVSGEMQLEIPSGLRAWVPASALANSPERRTEIKYHGVGSSWQDWSELIYGRWVEYTGQPIWIHPTYIKTVLPVLVEGLEETAAEIVATFTPEGGYDTSLSNLSGEITFKTGALGVDTIGGKNIASNSHDKDGDDVPDHLDGFNGDELDDEIPGGAGTNNNRAYDDRMTAGASSFVPLQITIPAWVDLTEATFGFSYSISDSSPVLFSTLRLWTVDEIEQRNARYANDLYSPGHLIGSTSPHVLSYSGTLPYTFEQLGGEIAERSITLFVEGISPGTYSISVYMNAGTYLSQSTFVDSVDVTVYDTVRLATIDAYHREGDSSPQIRAYSSSDDLTYGVFYKLVVEDGARVVANRNLVAIDSSTYVGRLSDPETDLPTLINHFRSPDRPEWNDRVRVALIAGAEFAALASEHPLLRLLNTSGVASVPTYRLGAESSAEVTLLDDDALASSSSRNADVRSTGLVHERVGALDGKIKVDVHDGSLEIGVLSGIGMPTYRSNDNLAPLISLDLRLPLQDYSEICLLTGRVTFAGFRSEEEVIFDIDGLQDYLATDPGRIIRLVLPGPTDLLSKLPTGSYAYSVEITAVIGETTRSLTHVGRTEIINRSDDKLGTTEFGKGWWLEGLDRIVPSDGVTPFGKTPVIQDALGDRYTLTDPVAQSSLTQSGFALIRGDNTSAWFVGRPNSVVSSTLPSFSDQYTWRRHSLGSPFSFTAPHFVTSAALRQEVQTAEWRFENLVAGKTYQVFVDYIADSNRATNAPYTVEGAYAVGSSESSKTIFVNQRIQPNHELQFNTPKRSIGFFVAAGEPGQPATITVRLSTQLPTGDDGEVEFANGSISARQIFLGTDWYLHAPDGSYVSLQQGFSDYTAYYSDYWFEPGYSAPTGYFTLLDKHGTRSEFDAHGLLRTVVDRNGNRTEYSYLDYDDDDVEDELASVTVQGGLVTRYQRSGNSYTVTDFAQRVTTFQLEGGQVVSVHQPEPGVSYPSGIPGSAPTTIITRFEYDGPDGLLSRIVDANNSGLPIESQHSAVVEYSPGTHAVSKITTPDGEYWELTPYLLDGLGSETTMGQLFAPSTGAIGNRSNLQLELPEQVATYTDPRGIVWQYQTDHFGLLTAFAKPAVTLAATPDAQTASDVWRWLRRQDGLVHTAIEPAGGGGVVTLGELLTTYTYDARGNLKKLTRPTGATETWDYDALSLVVTYRDPLDQRTTFSRPTTMRGNATVVSEPGGRKTSYTYTLPPQSINDLPGGLVLTETLGGITTQTEYFTAADDLNDTTEIKRKRIGLPKNVTKALGTSVEGTLEYDYNQYRNLSSLVDELDRETKYTYDRLNRLVKIEEPDPAAGLPDVRSTHGKPITHYGYDAVGNRRFTLDARGILTETQYDAMNRAQRVVNAAPGGHTDTQQVQSWTEYVYDAAGSLWKTIESVVSGQEFRHIETAHYYDERNRLYRTELPAPNVEAPLGVPQDTLVAPVLLYTYDALGNLKASSDPRNSYAWTTYSYDQLGRQTQATLPLAAVGPSYRSQTTTYRYDAVGNLRFMIASGKDEQDEITEHHYDSRNRLIKTTLPADAHGNRETIGYRYDYRDNRTQIIDAYGNATVTNYDERNRVKDITTPAPSPGVPGTRTRYIYTAADEVEQAILEDLSGELAPQVTSYAYDNLGRVYKQVLPDPDGDGSLSAPVYFYEHDAVGNVIAESYEASGELNGSYASIVNVTNYEYDNWGRLWKVLAPWVELRTTTLNVSGTPVRPETNIVYDALTRSSEQRVWNPIVGDNDHTIDTTSYFDDLGRLFRIDSPPDASGQRATTINYYDAIGNIRYTIDARGYATESRYDELGRLSQTILPATSQHVAPDLEYYYDLAGRLERSVDPLERPTLYSHDARGRRITTTLPTVPGGAPITATAYNKKGFATSSTDVEGNTTSIVSDLFGRTIGVVRPSTNGSGSIEESVKHDAFGRMRASTNQQGQTTQALFDAFNRQIATIEPGGDTSYTAYNALGLVEYIENAAGDRRKFTYDALGRVRSEEDEEGNITRFAYDLVGQLVELRDPRGNVTKYTYDDRGQVTTETVIISSLEQQREYHYDPAGNLEISVDRNGRATRYTYDTLNRITHEAWYASEADALANTDALDALSFVYDVAGRVASANGAEFSYSYQYDALDRLLIEAGPFWEVVSNYEPNRDGNRDYVNVSILGVVDTQTTFQYDDRRRVTVMRQAGQGNATVNDKRVEFTYGEDGRFDTIERYASSNTDHLAIETSYKYDEKNRLKSLRHRSNGESLVLYTYMYDALNRIDVMSSPDGVVDYQYDDRGQLIAALDISGSPLLSDESYQYDANGNQLAQETGDYNRTESDGKYSYEYDEEGNRVSRLNIATNELTEYTWDHRNRLVKVEDFDVYGQSVQVVTHTYDHLNRWIKRVVTVGSSTEVTKFVYDGYQIVAALDESNNVEHRYLWGPAVDQLLADEEVIAGQGVTRWALTDHLGTVRDLAEYDSVTGESEVVDHRVFDAFGRETYDSNAAIDALFGFTGRPFDEATGLQNNLNRWYDNVLHQWLSEDPKGFAAGDANLRRYANNDPVNRIDPMGLDDDLISVEVEYDYDTETLRFDVLYTDRRGWFSGLMLWGIGGLIPKEREPVKIGEVDPKSGFVRLNDGKWTSIEALEQEASEWTSWEHFSENRATSELPSSILPDGTLKSIARGSMSRENQFRKATEANDSAKELFKGVTPERFTEITTLTRDAGGLVNELLWFYALAPLDLASSVRTMQSAATAARSHQVSRQEQEVKELAKSLSVADEIRIGTRLKELQEAYCFARSTLVSTRDGLRPIGSIEPGELVYAFNFELGEWTLAEVVHRHDNLYIGEVVTIRIGDSTVEVTAHHPFWVLEGNQLSSRPQPDHLSVHEDERLSLPGRWVNSHDLAVGDRVVGRDGKVNTILEVTKRICDGFKVSNLTIAEHHSFAITDLEILVHNAGFCDVLIEAGRRKPASLEAFAKANNFVLHGHHIVQKTVPSQYARLKHFTKVDPSWKRSEQAAWYIGKSQEILESHNIPLLRDKADAMARARNNETLHNLTWAVNGNRTHSLETIRAVYETLEGVKKSKQLVEGALLDMGRTLSTGQRLFK